MRLVNYRRIGVIGLVLGAWLFGAGGICSAQQFYDNERVWKSDDPKYNFRRSEHFRVVWGKGVGEGDVNRDFHLMTEQRVQGHLQSLEQIWHKYHDPEPKGLGFYFPGKSVNPEHNDGKLYRCNFAFNNTGIWEGGAWGGVDDFGYQLFAINPGFTSYDPPTGATAHEYGHTVQTNTGGFNETPYDGMWHETGANWLDMQFIDDQDVGPMPSTHMFSLPHGRDYYHCWQIWEYLREQPAYGVKFFNTVWTQAKGNKAKGGEYMLDAMVRLDPSGSPDPYNKVKENLAHTAEHCLTWDFERGAFFRAESPLKIDPLDQNYRNGITELVRVVSPRRWGSDSPTWRVPFEHAPSQGGYNWIPVDLVDKNGAAGYKVGIDFKPLWDASRGSDWRACFVAINDKGEPRYGNEWNSGVNSITLSADENKLFLVVTAVPDFMGYEGFSHPLVSDPILFPQAYEVKFVDTRATAYQSESAKIPDGVTGKPHSNGGGFVADTAKVDPSAYVSSDAMVLDNAQVLGKARVYDNAVVMGNAVVKDNAILSDHALVKDKAEVSGNAKIRNWATVGGNWKVYDNARVLEHANLVDKGQLHENATIKGVAADFGNADVKGYAIKDGDCCNGANLDKSVLMCWVWGTDQDYANSRPDTGGVYCNYNFEKANPNYALDTFGTIHGYLIGKPQVVKTTDKALGNVLKLNGKDQCVEVREDVVDFNDMTMSLWINWDGSTSPQIIFEIRGCKVYLMPKEGSGGKVAYICGQHSISLPYNPWGRPGDPEIMAGKWTHVAVTYKGYNGTLYVDGKSVAVAGNEANSGIDGAAPPVAFRVGGSYSNYFGGMIDDFRVYGFAQPDSVIAELAATVKDKDAQITPTSVDNVLPPLPPLPPEFQMKPTAVCDNAVNMSAKRLVEKGPSGFEYYFKCTSGGGHDSGWISGSWYADCCLTPGKSYTYTVKVRDKNGCESKESAPYTVTIPADKEAPKVESVWESAPRGISDTAIKMVAGKATDFSGMVEYKFTRNDGKSSGWQSSRTWIDSGLKAGEKFGYTVQMRDGLHNIGAESPAKSAVAKDDTPPARFKKGEWTTRPYALIDNRIALRARPVNPSKGTKIEDNEVEYFYHCVSGGGPDSGWISNPTWDTPELKDGTYVYEFKIRDKSPQKNETGYSEAMSVIISNMTGYHPYKISELAKLPEGALVSFKGKVTSVEKDHYVVSGDGAKVNVVPATKGDQTDPGLNGKEVTVKGGMWIVSGDKRVTWADVK